MEDRKAQIVMLPLVGALIGVVLCLCWWLLSIIGCGSFLSGALLTGAYFLLTGFIHVDGFMDCSDAIMPRHPQMEERRRILKDPHTGAFAVICLCIMLLVFTGAMAEITPHFSLKNCSLLVVIFTASRTVSALEVIMRNPMETSQYSQLGVPGKASETIPAIVILIVFLGASELIMANFSWWALIAELRSNIIVLTVMVAAFITRSYDCRKLGGMNGDVSGHMITISELFGVLVMALII
jgi:adenosylcobinamide-GDP ribazoletransferase